MVAKECFILLYRFYNVLRCYSEGCFVVVKVARVLRVVVKVLLNVFRMLLCSLKGC